jgi:hypothetical protein
MLARSPDRPWPHSRAPRRGVGVGESARARGERRAPEGDAHPRDVEYGPEWRGLYQAASLAPSQRRLPRIGGKGRAAAPVWTTVSVPESGLTTTLANRAPHERPRGIRHFARIRSWRRWPSEVRRNAGYRRTVRAATLRLPTNQANVVSFARFRMDTSRLSSALLFQSKPFSVPLRQTRRFVFSL